MTCEELFNWAMVVVGGTANACGYAVEGHDILSLVQDVMNRAQGNRPDGTPMTQADCILIVQRVLLNATALADKLEELAKQQTPV